MSFIDEVTLYCRSGRGGAGAVHFRREKFVPRGGPDGGDGGQGGSVIVQVDPRLNTFIHLQGHPHQRAEHGQPGGAQRATGRGGKDCIVLVPPGTMVWDVAGRLLGDLTDSVDSVVIAQGGRGGKGNAHFASSVRRSPSHAQPGEGATDITVRLELRVLADVGLLGYPNAGKSTLLSRISAARPRIADYPFTTLTPNLGIVRGSEYRSAVVADIPGLIEGAASGRGLGNQFLRHVDRCRMLCHLVSLAPDEELDPITRYLNLRAELDARAKEEDSDLNTRPETVVLSKHDTATTQMLEQTVASFREKGIEPLLLSSISGHGVPKVRDAILAAGVRQDEVEDPQEADERLQTKS